MQIKIFPLTKVRFSESIIESALTIKNFIFLRFFLRLDVRMRKSSRRILDERYHKDVISLYVFDVLGTLLFFIKYICLLSFG